MSSDAVWKRDVSGIEHPSHEAILAFIRKQCAEDENNRIDEHLLTGCVSCNRAHIVLKQDSNLLNQLFDMSHGLYYPELQSNQVLLHMQRDVPLTSVWTGKRKVQAQNQLADRQLGRRAGLPIFKFSVPFAVGVILLFTTFAIVLTYSFANIIESQSRLSSQLSPQSHLPPAQTTIIEHQPTASATVTTTPSPELMVSPSPTSAPTIIKGARLVVCPWSQYSGWAVFICGRGFKGVGKVWLAIASHSSNARPYGPYLVNSYGEFEAWVYTACKNSPVIIVAVNKAQQPLTFPWTYTSKAGCYSPNPNVTPGSHP